MEGIDVVFVGYCASSLGVLECGSTAKAASLSFLRGIYGTFSSPPKAFAR